VLSTVPAIAHGWQVVTGRSDRDWASAVAVDGGGDVVAAGRIDGRLSVVKLAGGDGRQVWRYQFEEIFGGPVEFAPPTVAVTGTSTLHAGTVTLRLDGALAATAQIAPDGTWAATFDATTLAAAFGQCRQPQVRERAQALGTRIRETDGAELVVQSIYRQLPLGAMQCANHGDRLAIIECVACGDLRLCRDCATEHVSQSHLVRPCRYVDWDARPDAGFAGELGDLMGDAAKALLAGMEDIASKMGFR